MLFIELQRVKYSSNKRLLDPRLRLGFIAICLLVIVRIWSLTVLMMLTLFSEDGAIIGQSNFRTLKMNEKTKTRGDSLSYPSNGTVAQSKQNLVECNLGFINNNSFIIVSNTSNTSLISATVDGLPTLINNINVCSGKQAVDIIICVHSHPSNRHQRDAIRRTWAKSTYWSSRYRVRTIFFMGVAGPVNGEDNNRLQDSLEMENDKYNDIIQIGFIDTYRNLTLKALSVLRWVSTFCTNATYFFKVDDDVIVNTFAFQRILVESKDAAENRQIICYSFNNSVMSRKGKWAVTPEELPDDYCHYPTYCAGMGYVMRTQTAIDLYEASHYVPYFWIDDIYVTGFVAKRINASFRKILVAWNEWQSIRVLTGKRWSNYTLAHVKYVRMFTRIWDKFKRKRNDILYEQ